MHTECVIDRVSVITFAVNGGSNQLVSSVCVCPGYIATYKCTIVGGFATVWQGSAFNCTGNEISLLHSRFMSNKKKIAECNDGAILGQSLGIENNCYTSQLNVTVSYDMLGKNIECVQDDGRSTLGRMSTKIVKPTGYRNHVIIIYILYVHTYTLQLPFHRLIKLSSALLI